MTGSYICRRRNTVEQPKEVGQDKPSPMLGRDSDLDKQVIAELRLLAKTRERNSSTGKRASFRWLARWTSRYRSWNRGRPLSLS
jgi:hypothetical protein